MKALAIMYHDVVERSAWDSSGFPGKAAAAYKLERQEFERHLTAIRAALGRRPVGLVTAPWTPGVPVFLTFDDGGVSAHAAVAGVLENWGWRGHFFVTTNRIGTPGFLTAAQIRELHQRGHVVGSHSCSHPHWMSRCSREQMLREWHESARTLQQILGEPITVAAVPGGTHSRAVTQTAAEAGIRVLFHSEPSVQSVAIDGCLLLGRYCIRRGMGPQVSAGLAAGQAAPRWKQSLLWKLKKATKALFQRGVDAPRS